MAATRAAAASTSPALIPVTAPAQMPPPTWPAAETPPAPAPAEPLSYPCCGTRKPCNPPRHGPSSYYQISTITIKRLPTSFDEPLLHSRLPCRPSLSRSSAYSPSPTIPRKCAAIVEGERENETGIPRNPVSSRSARVRVYAHQSFHDTPRTSFPLIAPARHGTARDAKNL